jgi:hypothetical protein
MTMASRLCDDVVVVVVVRRRGAHARCAHVTRSRAPVARVARVVVVDVVVVVVGARERREASSGATDVAIRRRHARGSARLDAARRG